MWRVESAVLPILASISHHLRPCKLGSFPFSISILTSILCYANAPKMSPQHYPPAIPQIETAAPSESTPNSDPTNSSFYSTSSNPHTPPRSVSPAYSGRSGPSASGLSRVSTAQQLLQTPPAIDAHPSSNYFSARSAFRQTQPTSPSDGLSASSCLSPIPSSGGSFYSSDRSQCSHSSHDFLSPPPVQPDSDNPPYKPQSERSSSLTMMPQIRRARTDPNDRANGGHSARRRQRRKHKCRHRRKKRHEYQDETDWWLPECQVAPTAPEGLKELCLGRAGNYIPAKTPQGTTDTFGRILSRSKSRLASPLLTRRWSSVEIGAHQIHLKSTLPQRSPKSRRLASATPAKDKFASLDLKGRYRSSTFTRGAIDHDIIRTVRERLTLRKVPRAQLETPASITLRRASGTSNISDASTIIAALTPRPDLSGGTTPKARPHGELQQQRPSAAYLITSHDIKSITDLIEANLKRQHRDDRRRDVKPYYGSPPTPKGARSPNFTKEGLVPVGCSPTIPTVTAVEAERSSAGTKPPFDYLQVVPDLQRKRSTSRTNTQQSTHEVIWQGGGSPQSVSPVTDDEESRACIPSSEPVTPVDDSRQQRFNSAAKDKGDAFDPKNATASINEWSWRSMPNEVSVVVTSSDSESNDQTSRGSQSSHPLKVRKSIASKICESRSVSTRERPHPSGSPLDASLEDVVSFPPLPPRKTTNDWYSPLPALDTPLQTPSPNLKTSRSLYDMGLDMTVAPLTSSKTTPNASPKTTPKVTPSATRPSWLQSNDISRASTIEFNPSFNVQDKKMVKVESRTRSFEARPDVNDHRKSSFKLHPKPIPRTGECFAMGNAIGVSSGERRRSSAKALQRVQTIDNIHKGERTGTWGKWRPPSVCPTPQTPSPSELETEAEGFFHNRTPRQQRQSGLIRKTHSGRLNLLKDKGPPLPKVDHVGIYGRFTGNHKTEHKDCTEDCRPHTCEDCERDPRTPSVDWIG